MSRPPDPVGLYEPYIRWGSILFLSAISSAKNGELITGKVGRDIDLETAHEAARRAAQNLLDVLLAAVDGDASRIEQVLFVRGHVNATEEFPIVHKIIDSASELIIERLGDRGRHARTALGCATLPNNNVVTLEAMVAVQPIDGRPGS